MIRVPKPSNSSYNPNRPLEKNQLLLAHVKHMHEAEKFLPRAQRTGTDISTIKTEGQAAEYIKRVTSRIQIQADKAKGTQ